MWILGLKGLNRNGLRKYNHTASKIKESNYGKVLKILASIHLLESFT